MRADLHTHTTCSDGTVTPQDLLQAAKRAGLDVLSITDHDTLRAYDLFEPDPALQIIPGVELSASFEGYSVHLLAYSFSLQNASMRKLCSQQILRREKRNEEILHRLTRMGCTIKPEELYFTPSDQIGSIGRPHIAKILVNKGFAHSMRDAFDRFIGEDAPAFAAGARCSAQDILEIVHAANGFVVIAHPHYIKDKNVLQKMLHCPFDGIEAYYAHFTSDQVPYWLDIARQYNLFATGGSDFHGDVKPHHFLGSSLAPLETLRQLLDRTEANNVQSNSA